MVTKENFIRIKDTDTVSPLFDGEDILIHGASLTLTGNINITLGENGFEDVSMIESDGSDYANNYARRKSNITYKGFNNPILNLNGLISKYGIGTDDININHRYESIDYNLNNFSINTGTFEKFEKDLIDPSIFDGENIYQVISGNYINNQSFSIAGWFKTNTTDGTRVIFSKTNVLQIAIIDDTFIVKIHDGDNWKSLTKEFTNTSSDHFFLINYNSIYNTMSLFFDTDAEKFSLISDINENDNDITIGTEGMAYFDGILYRIMIFDDTLTASEKSDLYALGKTVDTSNLNNIVYANEFEDYYTLEVINDNTQLNEFRSTDIVVNANDVLRVKLNAETFTNPENIIITLIRNDGVRLSDNAYTFSTNEMVFNNIKEDHATARLLFTIKKDTNASVKLTTINTNIKKTEYDTYKLLNVYRLVRMATSGKTFYLNDDFLIPALQNYDNLTERILDGNGLKVVFESFKLSPIINDNNKGISFDVSFREDK